MANVFKYFKYGELFILSSLWEEVGFVIVEAAMSNLFVISSDCPNGPSEFLDKEIMEFYLIQIKRSFERCFNELFKIETTK